jgi:hypothetical protein
MKVPNKETRETFERTDRGEDLTTYETDEEMFKALGI